MAKRSKGRKKTTIRDVSRHWPTSEEKSAVTDRLNVDEDSIVVAILGQALVEHDLERLLRPKFKHNDATHWAKLTSEIGPLSSFSQKIITAHALGLINDGERDGLMVVKNVRNAFAHSKKLIEFTNEGILAELRNARLATVRKTKFVQDVIASGYAKATYLFLCLGLSTSITRRLVRVEKSRTRYLQKKLGRINALAKAAWESLGEDAQASLLAKLPFDPKVQFAAKGPLSLADLARPFLSSEDKKK